MIALLPIARAADPTWVEATVSAWVALPRESRIDALRAMVLAEPDDDRKSALIALGRLEQAWPEAASAEAYGVYARALVGAPDAGRRSFVVAAAGFGGALGPDGLPTMTVEQARGLYAERRLAPGVVAWTACAPPPGALGDVQHASGGSWYPGDLDAFRDRRKPATRFGGSAWHTAFPCRQGDLLAGTALGWTLFEGTRPVLAPADLPGGPSSCSPLHVRVRRVSGVYATADYVVPKTEVVDVEMPPRPQDCGTLAEWQRYADGVNGRILGDLRITTADVRDLDASSPTMDGFRACAVKKPPVEIAELCALR